jgi:DNA-binding HxlR family transcriptional regulator
MFACVIKPENDPMRLMLSGDPLADKWTLLILPALRQGPVRNGELLRIIGGVSQKMLTQTLRPLEGNGLVRRIDYLEVPPRVEYELTELGRSLSDTIKKLGVWAQENIAEVLAAREEFEKRERAQKP